jgi:hypothetical protein
MITALRKMYYIPPSYYWIDNEIYDNVRVELIKRLEMHKKEYYDYLSKFSKNSLINKNESYIFYKSSLIRLILLEYAHDKPNGRGKDLVDDIFETWNNNLKIKSKIKEQLYEKTLKKITSCEKQINNIEDIMLLVDINILENY